jgi:hypothetical protein
MSFFSSRKKLLVIGAVVILLIAIPLTIWYLQQQQEIRSRAEATTVLSFSPSSSVSSPIKADVDDEVSLDIMVDPGKNLVSFVKVEIQYDPEILETDKDSFEPDTLTFPTILGEPDVTPGKITATLSVGADPAKVIQTPKKAATIKFKVLQPTGDEPTEVTYLTQTQVLSIASTDQASENVLQQRIPAYILVEGDGGDPTPTSPTGGPTRGPTVTKRPGTGTPTPTDGDDDDGGVGGPNEPPVCESLNIDRTTTGAAPYSLTFTAVGNDTDGTISKVTFNFGDGPVEDVTTAGGIGTDAVSSEISHTYNNAGTYQASAVLTDDDGAVSTTTSCTQTITVEAGAPTQPIGGPNSGTDPNTSAPTQTPTPTLAGPSPTLEAAGPGDVFLGIGAVIGIITAIGGLMFFML